MRVRLVTFLAILAGLDSMIPAQLAHAQTCQELWVERNAYYNAVGYCFKTVRAIEYFGKKNCRLHSEEAAQSGWDEFVGERVKWIKKREGQIGCADTTSRGPRLTDATCGQLWVERNAYYKAGGYCFVTTRAINYFGLEGCKKYLDEDNVESNFSEALRARIAEIVDLERSYSCTVQ
jgi:hypothetical protein